MTTARVVGSVRIVAVLTLAIVLAGCGASPQGPADAASAPPPPTPAATYTIPETTNRPSDPPPPSDYDQSSNSRLTPEEASLGQLWAAANAEVGEGTEPLPIESAGGLRDFAAAISTRCYPIRSAEQAGELEALRLEYEANTGEAGFEPAQAYFVRATELCV